MSISKRPERRSPKREPDPQCPMCGAQADPKSVTVRTAYVFYKCPSCKHIWEVAVPADYRMKR